MLKALVHHEREDSHWLVSVLAIIKYPAILTLGSLVTIFLLYLMQYLIDSGEEAITSTNTENIVDFIRIKEDQQVQVKQDRPKPPPEPQEPPPPRLMLMISAGLVLAGMPVTVPPEAQVTASAMSDR